LTTLKSITLLKKQKGNSVAIGAYRHVPNWRA
jgi:hypothetical protein